MMGHYSQDRPYLASLGALAAIIMIGVLYLLAGGSSGEAESPPEATATAYSRTPTAGVDAATLDFARTLDLLAIRDALGAYYDEYGNFPNSGGEVVTLCEEPGEVGCALTDFDNDLAFDDGTATYWYASDGAAYTLIARVSLEQPDGQTCPDELPATLSDGPVICMTGEGE